MRSRRTRGKRRWRHCGPGLEAPLPAAKPDVMLLRDVVDVRGPGDRGAARWDGIAGMDRRDRSLVMQAPRRLARAGLQNPLEDHIALGRVDDDHEVRGGLHVERALAVVQHHVHVTSQGLLYHIYMYPDSGVLQQQTTQNNFRLHTKTQRHSILCFRLPHVLYLAPCLWCAPC